VPGGRIELVALTKRFAEVAVDEIDLQVASGEFFSLLGPSGCGKTTTLRLIAGFEQPTAGKILLDDVDVSGVPPHRRNVNTVFQGYALFPFLSVFDNVAFGLRNRKLSKQEIESQVHEALDLVKLRAFARRRPGQLSGGQQQRVALARALVLRPLPRRAWAAGPARRPVLAGPVLAAAAAPASGLPSPHPVARDEPGLLPERVGVDRQLQPRRCRCGSRRAGPRWTPGWAAAAAP
jgi:ABC-type uncharacterized transport system YnjBCD ATPase subunit